MKRFDKIALGVLALILAVFLCAHLALDRTKTSDVGRPHRVEISRLARGIEDGEAPDLSGCDYVTGIRRYGDGPEGFYDADCDYLIQQIRGELYRFDYVPAAEDGAAVVVLDLALGAMAVVVIAVMLLVRQRILRPFQVLSEVPYELSKGNLTIPIQESEGRFFGRFLWGVDMLRESLEAQKQRELELQKEKKTLLLSLSHDIKTPLSAIKLYSRALSRGLYTDEEKKRAIARSIDAKADEIEGFVSQIVRSSSEDVIRLEVTMGEFYLSQLVEQARGYYQDKLSLVKTQFDVAPYDDCLIRGDLDRSVEVVQNLMENAIKYGDGAHIGLTASEEDGGILVSVRNSGCTLPDAELPHIFDAFWRGSNAQKQKGSGLGLHICRQLMRQMDGEIYAQSRDGSMTVTAVFLKA